MTGAMLMETDVFRFIFLPMILVFHFRMVAKNLAWQDLAAIPLSRMTTMPVSVLLRKVFKLGPLTTGGPPRAIGRAVGSVV